MTPHPRSLPSLDRAIVSCTACPRLVAWREKVARQKVARFRGCTYWGRPVPGFGDPAAHLLIVGLAPGAHGANRTGRMFTGDRSGDFLYAALHRAGLANQAESTSADDGLSLRGVYITAAARCAPPDNKPLPAELAACAPFLDAEIELMPHIRAILALGSIAWAAVLGHLARTGVDLPRPRPSFGHGAHFAVPATATPQSARETVTRRVLGSYHVSQQNTQTGKLTPLMFDRVLAQALRSAMHTA
ncbi:MAG: uracil-DNA glycosylase [Polyangiaceae bacterium]